MTNAPPTLPATENPHCRILFVCMGNICRSPMAQGIFAELARQRGLSERFQLDSAGLGDWKMGQPPDPRAVTVLAEYHTTVEHFARVVRPMDFENFDLLIAMELEHVEELKEICPIPFFHHKLRLMREVDPLGIGPVPDPYPGEMEDFRDAYVILERCCRAWLDVLTAHPPIETPMTM